MKKCGQCANLNERKLNLSHAGFCPHKNKIRSTEMSSKDCSKFNHRREVHTGGAGHGHKNEGSKS